MSSCKQTARRSDSRGGMTLTRSRSSSRTTTPSTPACCSTTSTMRWLTYPRSNDNCVSHCTRTLAHLYIGWVDAWGQVGRQVVYIMLRNKPFEKVSDLSIAIRELKNDQSHRYHERLKLIISDACASEGLLVRRVHYQLANPPSMWAKDQDKLLEYMGPDSDFQSRLVDFANLPTTIEVALCLFSPNSSQTTSKMSFPNTQCTNRGGCMGCGGMVQAR